MNGELFGPIFVPDEFREAVSGRSWLRAMLDAEAALAIAEARVDLIPHEAAATIASCCDASRFVQLAIVAAAEGAAAAFAMNTAMLKEDLAARER